VRAGPAWSDDDLGQEQRPNAWAGVAVCAVEGAAEGWVGWGEGQWLRAGIWACVGGRLVLPTHVPYSISISTLVEQRRCVRAGLGLA
jgi:hypothetical protein